MTYDSRPPDANVRNVLIAGGALLALLLVVLGVLAWYHHRLDRPPAGPDSALARPFARDLRIPPEPRLQTSPPADLKQMFRETDSVLSSYGWVDREARVFRIPIERAMAIVAERAAANEPVVTAPEESLLIPTESGFTRYPLTPPSPTSPAYSPLRVTSESE